MTLCGLGLAAERGHMQQELAVHRSDPMSVLESLGVLVEVAVHVEEAHALVLGRRERRRTRISLPSAATVLLYRSGAFDCQ